MIVEELLLSWLEQLQPASWRGIPFAVERSETRMGRRTAVHEYPYRNEVWVEDLGRGVRGYSFYGFVVGDDCYQQEQALLAAAEQPGPGILYHPPLGSRTVCLVGPITTEQRVDRGRAVGLRMEFIESGDPVYPSGSTDTQAAVTTASAGATSAITSDFLSGVGPALTEGVDVVTAGVAASGSMSGEVAALGSDPGLVLSAVTGLSGNYGRYANGNRTTLLTGVTTPEQAIGRVITARTGITNAGALTTQLARNL